jgi:hypothetical protein
MVEHDADLVVAQLQKVFTAFDFSSPGLDWGVLHVALETLEHYLGRIDQVPEEQYSSEVTDNDDSQHLDDAVLVCFPHPSSSWSRADVIIAS